MARYLMNNEIKKYSNDIYYCELRYDSAGNVLTPHIGRADWINSTKDYDHCSFELHHVVPYTDWERNTKNVREIVGKNALILLEKRMHQHLENPIYRLSKKDFERVYGINPDVILFDVNSKLERNCDLFYKISDDTLRGGNYLPRIFHKNSQPPLSFEDLDLSCLEA